MWIEKVKESDIREAFQSLMGCNGDSFVQEILETKKLTKSSYQSIMDNVEYNSFGSIKKYFGLVHAFYVHEGVRIEIVRRDVEQIVDKF